MSWQLTPRGPAPSYEPNIEHEMSLSGRSMGSLLGWLESLGALEEGPIDRATLIPSEAFADNGGYFVSGAQVSGSLARIRRPGVDLADLPESARVEAHMPGLLVAFLDFLELTKLGGFEVG